VRRKPQGGSGRIHWRVVRVEQDELLKVQKGHFPDELVRREDTQIHCVNDQTYYQ
jgi:hypothetical protein